MTIYPNPINSGQFPTIFLGKEGMPYDKSVNLSLFSIDGKLLYTNNYSSGHFMLEVQNLPVGMYFVKLQTTEGEIYTNKFVIVH